MTVGIYIAAVGAVVSYIATSAFFWHNPLLLHKRKKPNFSAFHISHRGGSGEGYENTLKNFQRAVDGGTNMLELDVRLTKDRQVVVCHDIDLERLTGHAIKISDVDYHQLPAIKANLPVDSVPGLIYNEPSWTEEERKIPLLRHVFSTFPSTPMNIDLKDNDSELVTDVSDLISEYNRESITVWGSFNNNVCQECFKVNSDVNMFFSAKRAIILLALAVTGLLPFVPLKETYFEVFLPLYVVRRRLSEVPSLSCKEKFLLWITEVLLLGKPVINHLKKRGIQVYFWVCNNEEEFRKCLELGADGIMTDYPTRLHSFIKANEGKAQ